MIPLNSKFLASVQACFALPGVRVPDDSLRTPTFRVIDGHRFGYDFERDARGVYWCLLTPKVEMVGFVFVTPDGVDLLRGLSGLADGFAALRRSRAEALEEIRLAKLAARKTEDRDFLDAVTVEEVPVAEDELRLRFISSSIMRDRLGTPWGQKIKFPVATSA